MAICPNCNKEIEDGSKFCNFCGHKIGDAVVAEAANPNKSKINGFLLTAKAFVLGLWKKVKALPRLYLIIGAAALAALIVMITVLSVVISLLKPTNDHIMYLKDNEVFFANMKKQDPWQVTSDLFEGVNAPDSSDVAYAISYYFTLSEDGKTLFYIDKTGDSNYVSLYYRNAKKPNSEPNKISSEVASYNVNEKATVVTYLKGVEGALYQYSVKKQETEKIASDVKNYRVSPDGKRIFFLTSDGGLYYYISGKDKVKVESDLTEMFATPDKELSAAYYVKEGSLYKVEIGEEKEKIASDVDSVYRGNADGDIYFLKVTSTTNSILDYIVDDMKATDDAMTQPVAPDRPYRYEYDTQEEYDAAYEQYEKDYDAYSLAWDEYYEKQRRDNIRETLKETQYVMESYTLYYYDGEEVVEVIKDFSHSLASSSSSNTWVISAVDMTKFVKVKLSEITYAGGAEYLVDDAIENAGNVYVCHEDKVTALQIENARNFRINSEGTELFYLTNVSGETAKGDLYRIKIKKGKPSDPELYNTDVNTTNMSFVSDKFIYFKDYSEETSRGELYIGKEKVDFDVYVYDVKYNEEKNQLIYFTDWNSEKKNGTLKSYSKGKTTKIGDEISQFEFSSEGKILYLYDYSTTYKKGDLYIYNKGKATKLDMDVSCIVPSK